MPPRSSQRGADRRSIPPSSKRRKNDIRALNSFFKAIEEDDQDNDEVMLSAPPRQPRATSHSVVISEDEDDDFEEPNIKKPVKRKVVSDDDFIPDVPKKQSRQAYKKKSGKKQMEQSSDDEDDVMIIEDDVMIIEDEPDEDEPDKDDVDDDDENGPVKTKGTRRTDKQLKIDFENGDDTVFKCEKCDVIGSMKNIKTHQCNLSALKKPFDKNSTHFEVIKIRAQKRYLQSCLKTEHKVFALDKLRDAVTRQHLIKLYGCIVLHGFIQYTLQEVSLDNVGQYALRKTKPLLIA